jgi:hypothetical protein
MTAPCCASLPQTDMCLTSQPLVTSPHVAAPVLEAPHDSGIGGFWIRLRAMSTRRCEGTSACREGRPVDTHVCHHSVRAGRGNVAASFSAEGGPASGGSSPRRSPQRGGGGLKASATCPLVQQGPQCVGAGLAPARPAGGPAPRGRPRGAPRARRKPGLGVLEGCQCRGGAWRKTSEAWNLEPWSLKLRAKVPGLQSAPPQPAFSA